MRALWSQIALILVAAGCRANTTHGQAAGTEQNKEGPGQPNVAARPETPAERVIPERIEVGGVMSCRPEAQVEATVTRLVELADANVDGKISKDEANGLTNVIVGGFFFRADANGDGLVTPEEGKQARAEFMNQHPEIAALFQDVRKTTGQSPFATLARLFDVEYGKPLSIAEARDAARRAVDDLYRAADRDHDGFISRAEASAVAWEGARALGRSAFQAADTDHNGRLSLQEFQAAVQGPVKVSFDTADTNNDGQLTEEEAARATGQLVRRLGIQPPTAK